MDEPLGPAGALDVAALSRWLADVRPDLAARPLSARLLTGGRSNLTYQIDGAEVPLVLRRPPLAHVLSSAHDMRREHRVLSRLAATPVPVPGAVAYGDGDDAASRAVTGTPFFLMAWVPGQVLQHRQQNAGFRPAGLRRLGTSLVEVLADLHGLDPERVGLGDLGRPDGYLGRQLSTWGRQYDRSRSRALPTLDALRERLGGSLPDPSGRPPAIVHGDYRLDNVLVQAESGHPRLRAVLDWEMSTLGDPLVDLGLLGLYWEIDAVGGSAAALASSAVDVQAGYPTFPELVDAYAARAGVVVPDLSWYRAFASFKLAVIIEQIHFRSHGAAANAAPSNGAGTGDRLGDLVEPIAELGLAWATTRSR